MFIISAIGMVVSGSAVVASTGYIIYMCTKIF